MMLSTVYSCATLVCLATCQQLARDPCIGGVPAEVVHLYYDEYPQGVLCSSALSLEKMILIYHLLNRRCGFFDWPQILELCSILVCTFRSLFFPFCAGLVNSE